MTHTARQSMRPMRDRDPGGTVRRSAALQGQEVSCIRRTAPVLLAASSSCDAGFQHTALMNWLMSWGVAGAAGGAANRRCASGLDIAWWYTNTCTTSPASLSQMLKWRWDALDLAVHEHVELAGRIICAGRTRAA